MHEPDDYDCPFCRVQEGVHNEHNQPGDVVAVTDLAYALVSPKWWRGNPGAALVIPRDHHENLYDIPTGAGHAVWDLTQRVVRHLHVHVFPRHTDDRLFERNGSTRWVTPQEREPYAERLAAALDLPRAFS